VHKDPFQRIARRYSRNVPFDFSIYGASEGLFAAVDELESAKQQLLLTGSGSIEIKKGTRRVTGS